MRTALCLALLAIAAVAVFGQTGNTVVPAPTGTDEYTPAIMTPPPSSLKKPIIFDAAAAVGADADAPLIGAPPANLTKAVVTEHIYGGVVEFAKGRTPGGCRCRKQLPEKFRYDTQFKRTPQVNATTPCGCPAAPAPKPEDKLPPVIARLYPVRNATVNATAPCPAPPAPVVQKIAPSYYPKRAGPRALARAAALAAAPCAKNATQPAAPATITPSFYPTRAERRQRRKARKAKKAAAKKL